MENKFNKRISYCLLSLTLAGGILWAGADQGGSIIVKPGPNVRLKPVPSLPLLSATLEYVESKKATKAHRSRQVFAVADLKAINQLFWRNATHILISSYPSNDPLSFDGLRFRDLSLQQGTVVERGRFDLALKEEDDVIGTAMYPERSELGLRLWTIEGRGLPTSLLTATDKKVDVEHSHKEFKQSEALQNELSGRLLLPFGNNSGKCTNTAGDDSSISVADTVGNEFVRFELPPAPDDDLHVYRIWPRVQPLVVDTGKEFVGLLMTVVAEYPCFTERPPMDLMQFTVPHPAKGKEKQLQKARFRTIPGEGDLLKELRDKWKIKAWNIGTIEWAELVDTAGAVVLRRDTRVGTEFWCSEIWYYDQAGKGNLIDFMVIVQEGGYLSRFTIDEKGLVVQVPHHADYWGVGGNMIPAISPDRKHIAYSKWDSIWIAELPSGNDID